MKQILHSLKTGSVQTANIPAPSTKAGQLLINTSRSLVSAGTERMLISFGQAGFIDKARQQPDKLRLTLDKIKTDGLLPTVDSVLQKLNQPLPLGYCNVGTVTDIGSGVSGFTIGDRVISNGNHAQVVSVSTNLCAKIPDSVSDDAAAFTVLGAIALQGIRLVNPTLGECVVVTGLGLIGLLTVQLLRAHGCRVLALDFDKDRLALARQFGAHVLDLSLTPDPLGAADVFSRGRGVDAVIITASTKSSEPIHQAALMCRKRARIVLVGVAGMDLSREDFYKKELTFQVSASYGPGRYDPNYEDKGLDYPIGFVRWTEQRNFEAVLDMLAAGSLDVTPLISHRFNVNDSEAAYMLLAGSQPSLGILLEYPSFTLTSEERSLSLKLPQSSLDNSRPNKPVVGFIGAGNYASAVLIPAFKDAGVHLHSVASSSGVSGFYAGHRFGFELMTTDADRILRDPTISTVVITTRHDTHASFVQKALLANKNVFVEKPLCLTLSDLAGIEALYNNIFSANTKPPILMVGFNRRFSPLVQKVKQLLSTASGPKSFVFTVNAGSIPSDHWTQDPAVGGGRLVGEGCHFIDLLRYLAESPVSESISTCMKSPTSDTYTIHLKFVDGSIGTIHYFANGPKSFPKERLEVFVDGRVLQLDNFKRLTGYNWPKFRRMHLMKQNKGQSACASAFVKSVIHRRIAPIPFEEIIEVSRISIELSIQ